MGASANGGTFTSSSGNYVFMTPDLFPKTLSAPDDVYDAQYVNPRTLTVVFKPRNNINIGIFIHVDSKPYYPLAAIMTVDDDEAEARTMFYWVYKDYKTPSEASKQEYVKWMMKHEKVH